MLAAKVDVIENVLVNARRHTGRGGSVRLTCHPEPGFIALDERANGPGVRIEEREAIFERGICGSAIPTHDGTGVCLAAARDILRAHGGTVTVHDSPDGGARFLIRLLGETAFRPCDACGMATPPPQTF